MIAEEVTYFRDDSGRVSHTEKHYQDGSVDTTRYAYDDAGQLTGKTTTSDEGETEQIETFIWDQGKVVAHEVTDGAGNPAETEYPGRIDQHEIKVTRNEHDQVVSEEELDENGETLMTVHRSYNPDGTAHEVEVFQDGRGRTISRHYFLRYEYTFFE
jgi:YD repeat-containing protein